ncbi:MAG: hypothetical protein RIR43_733 [Pseudomonadota bacterium]|jgi:uncharacterized alpha-E superfamily protein
MLSRTADHLFWMARYMERAENTARMLDVNYQTSLLPERGVSSEAAWSAVLGISELHHAYFNRHRTLNSDGVMHFMVRDTANFSSIASCLSAARENARAVRSALTTELWETTNQTWLEFSRMMAGDALERDPSAVFEWVKFRSHLSRGVAVGTMLQDEALHFIRLGTFLERGDNTARLLDVKFHGHPNVDGHALPTEARAAPPAAAAVIAPETDFYHWSALLRSVSAFEIYRRVYSSVILPEKVAELLILRPDMPRSLAACTSELVNNLTQVANEQSGDTLRRAGRLRSDLQYGRIDEILDDGLHAYLTRFLNRINDIGDRIARDFLAAA